MLTQGFNTARSHLNDGAGSNFLYTQRQIPSGFTSSTAQAKRFCSLDGDADRLLYWRVTRAGELRVLDGDKEMALASLWLRRQLDALALPDAQLGVVKTAYANGASTAWAAAHAIPVRVAKTGVGARRGVEAGEASAPARQPAGRRALLRGQRTRHRPLPARLRRPPASARRGRADGEACGRRARQPQQEAARQRLMWAAVLVNQAVGDALSDALFLEAVLVTMDMTVEQFDALYENLPW